MKFNTVIIGGGLSGLTAGIELLKRDQSVAIVSAGQSALHFCSGSFDLLGYDGEGRPVDSPLDAVASLPEEHPYRRMGVEKMRSLLPLAHDILTDTGLNVMGSADHNHWRLTPLGMFKPAWLTLEDYVRYDSPERLPHKRVALVQLQGFPDFFPRFLAMGLEKKGLECSIVTINTPMLERLRRSTTEMRAANIARTMTLPALEEMAAALNRQISDCDAIYMPAVVGFNNSYDARRLREMVSLPLHFVATMGTSVPGIRSQLMMAMQFRRMGGAYLPGDSIVGGVFNDTTNRLVHLESANCDNDWFEADNYIFAAGSFFNHAIVALPDKVVEPALNLDIDAPRGRDERFDKDLFKPQPYMKYGLAVDDAFHATRGGRPVDNLYVAGSALAHVDSLREGSGAGVAMLTALNAVQTICPKRLD